MSLYSSLLPLPFARLFSPSCFAPFLLSTCIFSRNTAWLFSICRPPVSNPAAGRLSFRRSWRLPLQRAEDIPPGLKLRCSTLTWNFDLVVLPYTHSRSPGPPDASLPFLSFVSRCCCFPLLIPSPMTYRVDEPRINSLRSLCEVHTFYFHSPECITNIFL